jgi:hypothetical protein
LEENEAYFYRVAAISANGEESNFTKEFEVSTLPDLSSPLDVKVEVVNTKHRPVIARLTWKTAGDKSRPDHWMIERKRDVPNDTFKFLGRAYTDEKFFDRNLNVGASYVYRVKSVDLVGRESAFFEARLTL